jgi:hypothetical protein
MDSLDNPFNRHRGAALPDGSADIKLWARQILALPEDTSLSVSQFGCAKPSCPRQMTTILIMSEHAPTWKISIHKSIGDVCENDIEEAILDPRNARPGYL